MTDPADRSSSGPKWGQRGADLFAGRDGQMSMSVQDGRRVVSRGTAVTVSPSTKRTAGQRDHRPAARRSSGGMPGDGGAGIPCRTAVPLEWTTEEQMKNNRIAAGRLSVGTQAAKAVSLSRYS